MHTEEAFKEFKKVANLADDAFKVEKLENGVTRIICPEHAFIHKDKWKAATVVNNSGEKIEGAKTLWPAHYTPDDIAEAAKEILSNPMNKVKNGEFIGKTSKGITTKIYLTPEGNIATAFPLWNQ